RKSPKWGTPDSPAEKMIKAEIARMEQLVDALKAAQSQHAAAKQGLRTLESNTGDATANESVGSYLCFIKNHWEAGLPFLAKARDIRWRGIAALELASDRSQQDMLSLANQYWDLASRYKQPQRRGVHLRAVYYYELVAGGLASSLEKAKIEKR